MTSSDKNEGEREACDIDVMQGHSFTFELVSSSPDLRISFVFLVLMAIEIANQHQAETGAEFDGTNGHAVGYVTMRIQRNNNKKERSSGLCLIDEIVSLSSRTNPVFLHSHSTLS